MTILKLKKGDMVHAYLHASCKNDGSDGEAEERADVEVTEGNFDGGTFVQVFWATEEQMWDISADTNRKIDKCRDFGKVLRKL